ncbi:hypothetical protein FRB91_000694 [Serendipita sp. 411]|nr:hypothetical protein FRC15_004304 [Serendipita sp. 397]KAG8798210.1 hypothetical protein FRC16_007717 [Serendipita sp. 398]KAG8823942.1 hypothetical protein FRC19_002816 [Serendipita sp. 401]KAG8856537.1 hypothetical protein FRB91_000694 [Serendipita sp. 411]KAG8866509.1 hypothetical protein FRC20_008282 [Serendipita sp. 405]
MATLASHNTANASIKRILREARQLQEDPATEFTAGPLEDNLFDWHCTLRGPKDTEFEGGLYHVRITLPPTYPFRPPSLRVLTPSGRFEVDTPVCISFTNYHEELWQPAWGIRTCEQAVPAPPFIFPPDADTIRAAIIGLQGFFAQSGMQALGVGALNAPATERRRLATLSRDWQCPHCKQRNIELLPDIVETTPVATSTDASNMEQRPSEQAQVSVSLSNSSVAPTHIAIPAFSSTVTSSATLPENATTPSLKPPPASPARNMPFFELGPNSVPLGASGDTPRSRRPHSDVDNVTRPIPQPHDQPNGHAHIQAFPVIRDSDPEGVPFWLDSAILVFSVLLGGIMIHRVIF